MGRFLPTSNDQAVVVSVAQFEQVTQGHHDIMLLIQWDDALQRPLCLPILTSIATLPPPLQEPNGRTTVWLPIQDADMWTL
jgi:hypothetical protein